jgi:hypothetical protein
MRCGACSDSVLANANSATRCPLGESSKISMTADASTMISGCPSPP